VPFVPTEAASSDAAMGATEDTARPMQTTLAPPEAVVNEMVPVEMLTQAPIDTTQVPIEMPNLVPVENTQVPMEAVGDETVPEVPIKTTQVPMEVTTMAVPVEMLTGALTETTQVPIEASTLAPMETTQVTTEAVADESVLGVPIETTHVPAEATTAAVPVETLTRASTETTQVPIEMSTVAPVETTQVPMEAVADETVPEASIETTQVPMEVTTVAVPVEMLTGAPTETTQVPTEASTLALTETTQVTTEIATGAPMEATEVPMEATTTVAATEAPIEITQGPAEATPAVAVTAAPAEAMTGALVEATTAALVEGDTEEPLHSSTFRSGTTEDDTAVAENWENYAEHQNFCVSSDGADLEATPTSEGDSELSACLSLCLATSACSAVEWYNGGMGGIRCHLVQEGRHAVGGYGGSEFLDARCYVKTTTTAPEVKDEKCKVLPPHTEASDMTVPTNIFAGELVHVACSVGFEGTQRQWSIECMGDGSWAAREFSSSLPDCRPRRCEMHDPGGTWEVSGSRNETLRLVCLDGLAPTNGSSVLNCSESAAWGAEILVARCMTMTTVGDNSKQVWNGVLLWLPLLIALVLLAFGALGAFAKKSRGASARTVRHGAESILLTELEESTPVAIIDME